MLATGPDNLNAVGFLGSGSVPFGSRPSQKNPPLYLGAVVSLLTYKPAAFGLD
jgi:hypothetical protein